MSYTVLHTDDIDVTDLSEIPEMVPDLDIQSVDDALGAEDVRLKLWHFEPGEEITYHAHAEQEEIYYVLQGTFSLKVGKSGEEEYIEAGPGTFWRAGPYTGHGHRNVGDERGIVLAIGAPNVSDPGLDPHSLDDE